MFLVRNSKSLKIILKKTVGCGVKMAEYYDGDWDLYEELEHCYVFIDGGRLKFQSKYDTDQETFFNVSELKALAEELK